MLGRYGDASMLDSVREPRTAFVTDSERLCGEHRRKCAANLSAPRVALVVVVRFRWHLVRYCEVLRARESGSACSRPPTNKDARSELSG